MVQYFKKLLSSSEFIVISLSLLLTIFISSLAGLGGYLIIKNFLGVFIISFCIQFVGFIILNTILQRKDDIANTKIINEHLNTLAKYSVTLPCAYCTKTSQAPVILNQENKLNCEYCNQVSGIKMQFFTTQITTPLQSITLPVLPQNEDANS